MNNRIIAISQSNYIPWKGYFDFIKSVDTFVFLDDVQYTRGDWRNRNIVKSAHGPLWLSIPVKSRGRSGQRIADTIVQSASWAKQHSRTIEHVYKQSKHFDQFWDWLKSLYERAAEFERLKAINRLFLFEILKVLEIRTEIRDSSELELDEGKTARLVSMCLQLNATKYVSAPNTKSYLDTSLFQKAGIQVRFFAYPEYPEYEQLFPPFEHKVSIIDTILNCGYSTVGMLKGVDILDSD